MESSLLPWESAHRLRSAGGPFSAPSVGSEGMQMWAFSPVPPALRGTNSLGFFFAVLPPPLGSSLSEDGLIRSAFSGFFSWIRTPL